MFSLLFASLPCVFYMCLIILAFGLQCEAELREKYDRAVVQIRQLKVELEKQRQRITTSEEMAE